MTIHVALGARSYPIHIERGLLGRAADHLVPLARGRTMAIVTDENVRPHLDTLQTALTAAGVASASIVLAPGEDDRTSIVCGQGVTVRVGVGGRRIMHKNNTQLIY